MKIEHIAPDLIPQEWDWMGPLLRAAIALDPIQTTDTVFAELRAARMGAFRISDGADGVLILQVSGPDDHRVLHLSYAAGKIEGAPKERLRKMQEAETILIDLARKLGCTEVQGGGRRWHKVLRGWEHDGGEGISLRKAL